MKPSGVEPGGSHGRSMPGEQGSGAGEGRPIPGRAGPPESKGETALPDGPPIKGSRFTAKLPTTPQMPSKCTSHLGFGLGAGFIYVLDLCWMSNNVGWTTAIWGVVGFLMAMGVAYSGMESSYRKKKAEEQKKLDEERRRRLEEAQLRWLEEQEQGGQGPPPTPP